MKTTIQWYKPRDWEWLIEDGELHVYPETPKEPISAVKQGIEWDNPTDESQLFIQLLYKLLLLKDSQYGYYKNGMFTTLGTTYPTAKDFEDFGMDDYNVITNELIQNDLLQADKIQLLNWFENEESVELGVTGDLSRKFTHVIEELSPQQIGKIVITDSNMGTKYLVSTDKETWQRWNGSEWEVVTWESKDEIENLGMSKNTVKDITESQWEKLGDTMYLGIFLKNYDSKVEKIDFQQLLPEFTPTVSSASLYILNTVAEIQVDFIGNKLQGMISDADDGKVQYRVILNNEPLQPDTGEFTPLEPQPNHINIRIPSSKIKLGEPNTIRIEFQDAWGSIDSWESTFIGEMGGLLFYDEEGNLYTDDEGQVIKPLDFGDLVSGQNSMTHKIRFENKAGTPIKNSVFTAKWEEGEQPDGVKLEFSKTDSPFEALSSVEFKEVLEYEQSVEFYVRLSTTLGMTPTVAGDVRICVTTEEVDENTIEDEETQ